MRSNRSARLIMLILATACSRGASAVDLYVAPNGKVEWSGELAEANADRSDGPLPSIEAARDRIRSSRAEGKWLDQPININVRGGTYFLEDTIVFEPRDSGTKDKPVVYAAYRDEKPVLSGGRLISGWREAEVNGRPCWAAEIPEVKQGKWHFRQLFVNGRRCRPPRVPKEGYYQLVRLPDAPEGQKKKPTSDTAFFRPGDLRNWRNLGDIEYVSMEMWDESHLTIREVDETKHRVKFTLESYFLMGQTPQGADICTRFYLKYVFEALDEPGEWYLDRPTGTLYYLPLPGETPDNTQVIAPRLDYLLQMSTSTGGSETVHDIQLQGLTFCHNDWWLPAGERQGGQAARGIPGAIILQNAL
ncbi:MAG: hypothetical protein GX616_18710, partial [Planctomycetes bacterium]|nr:hypothetical protein [Planctomycetota bacterium]